MLNISVDLFFSLLRMWGVMDYIAVFAYMLIFGGLGLGIGYAIGYKKGVERERERRAEKEETV